MAEKTNFTLINVLSDDKTDVFLRQVKPEEIGKKYKLVKGEKDLYGEIYEKNK